MKKKIVSLLLVAAMVTSMGCGGNDSSSNNSSSNNNSNNSSSGSDSTGGSESSGSSDSSGSGASDVEKPDKISIMVDGTVFTKENARDEFIAKLEELIGIKIEVTQPDHSGYYDSVGQVLADPNQWPDVLILSSTYYSSYAEQGVLWDMTEVYESSDLKKRHDSAGTSGVIDSLRLDGSLYGMPAARGNGCVTYVKQAWLDKCGLSVPTNYEEYIAMFEAFEENGLINSAANKYGVTAAKFLGDEAPYTNYLPEFYQGANPSFYISSDGTWVDGFEEDAMKEALQRMQEAYAAGYIDKETLTNGTSDCRNKFYDDNIGVFTYWAGKWATNLKNNLENKNVDSDLVALPPIAEVGQYIDRVPPTWCITNACDNPEGVFKYFIEAMQDGGDVQFLWTYGVEDVHWSTKGETLYEGASNEVTYEEGQFHMLDNLENPGSQYTAAHIDPTLALVELANDPKDEVVPEEWLTAAELFIENCTPATLVPSTDEMAQYNGDLISKKRELVANVVTGAMTVDQAYAEYESSAEGKALSDIIVDSLNNR